ncbi:unnamed protein product [Meganyctiphanes norvegica]|uniref:Protein msta n=1 Tax=Meganyctiphanes norvegica TaxID=48144 RepID=A0AAV2PVX7_MEGNR
MPGEAHKDVPSAVPLQIVVGAPPLSGVVNGVANASSNAAAASSPDPPQGVSTTCECGKAASVVCGGCWSTGYCSRAHQIDGWPKHKDSCKCYKIASSPEIGRYMVAARDVQAGELILQDMALLLGPKMITEPLCLGCYKPTAEGDYLCTICGFPMCSKDCQDVSDHEPECKAIVSSGTKVKVSIFGEINSMYECIMPLRILATKQSCPSVWNKLMTLESHSDKREGTEQYAVTQLTVVDILHRRLKLEPTYSTELIQKVIGIIDTNAFEIRLPESCIQGVYQKGSLLEHNCIPNSHRTFDENLSLVVRAAVNIKRGEHITSCYTDPLSTTINRVEGLRISKYFTCQCSRCLDPTELNTFVSALKCSPCSKKILEEEAEALAKAKGPKSPRGVQRRANPFAPKFAAALLGGNSSQQEDDKPGPWVVPTDPISQNSTWKCLRCGTCQNDEYPNNITEILVEEAEELDQDSNMTIEIYEAFLDKWDHIFHPNHAVFMNIKYALLHLYGTEEGHQMDDLNLAQLTRKEELCRQVLKVADVISPGISRLRGSVQYELYQALYYKARYLFLNGAATSDYSRKTAMDASTALKECIRILCYEPEVQPEGQLGIQAKEEMQTLQQWIKDHV